jgi:hypothetical protein
MRVTDALKAAREFADSGFTQAESLASQQERTAEEIVTHIRQALTPEFSALRAEMHSLSRDQLRSFTMIVFALAAFHLATLGVAITLWFRLAR